MMDATHAARVGAMDVRVIAGIVVCLAILLGVFAVMVAKAHTVATPGDQADCRRDRGVPVLAPGGSVVCISKALVIWEAARQ